MVLPNAKFLVDIFTLEILNISFHWYLASMVSVEKMSCYPNDDPLYMISYYSLDVLNVLSFALAFDSLIKICLTVSLFGFIPLGVSLAFWISRFMYFTKCWKFSVILIRILIFCSFPNSFLGSHKVDVSTIDWVPWVLRFYLFFFIPFSFWWSHWKFFILLQSCCFFLRFPIVYCSNSLVNLKMFR